MPRRLLLALGIVLLLGACHSGQTSPSPAARTAGGTPPAATGSVVSLSVSVDSGVAPLTVRFTNTSIEGQAPRWDFGDGTTSTGA
jgi:PKD repeat protein